MQHHQDLGQGLFKMARPLVVLTKKDVEFVWGSEQKEVMEDLKQAIVTALVSG